MTVASETTIIGTFIPLIIDRIVDVEQSYVVIFLLIIKLNTINIY
jgi:hypothetical protein